jgi:penicillin-binding protein 1A
MVAAHDTDNIPQIPGIELHPVQVAEQQRLAAAAAQNASAAAEETPAPAPAESVKDMSQATREVLDKISTLLKDARRLTPSDASKPDRAEAPAPPATGSSSKPSLASTNGEAQPQPSADVVLVPAEPQTALSTGKDDAAPVPH